MLLSQAHEDHSLAGHVYVQFSLHDLVTQSRKTGIAAFDSRAARFGVTAIEKAFPSLDVIAANRSLSPEMEKLRRVYLVQYDSPYRPDEVAAELGRVAEVTIS